MGTVRDREVTPERLTHLHDAMLNALDYLPLVVPEPGDKIKVILFKPLGKYYCEDVWRVPMGPVLGPYDMHRSPDFRTISGGPVLVPTRYWGYPHLLII